VHTPNVGDSPLSYNGAYAGTKGSSKHIEGFTIHVNRIPQIRGVTHQAGVGDVPYAAGAYAGSKSSSRPMECFSCEIYPPVPELGVEYMAHVANVGDVPWVANGTMLCERGKSHRMEGIAIRLTGAKAPLYNVTYDVHTQNVGDSAPVSNGAYAGTKGRSAYIEGFHATISRK
jgi:uncharacterized protein YjdB